MRSAERGGWEERTPLNRQAATKQEIHDRPAGDKGITIGDREVQIESAFNFCTEFDQVEGVAPRVARLSPIACATTANAAAAIVAIAFIFISITVQANLHPRG